MNIVIYARFSSSGQREESIEGQLEECYKFAAANNYKVIREYIDRASTGTNDHRAQFQKMIEDSSSHTFDAVLVYQLDRFARSRYDSVINKSKLKKNGVVVLSAKENIADDPSGIMLEGILETLAEYFSADLSQKILRGHHVNAEKCMYNGGHVPLGYKIDSERHYQIDPTTAPVVKKVFEDYASGKPIVDIVDDLKVHKIKNAAGNDFTQNSFRSMLKNKRYKGYYLYDDIEVPGGIPEIIDSKLFEEVQEKIEKNKNSPRAKNHYLLTTKLFCGKCNAMMVGVSGTSHTGDIHYYYVCNNKRNKKCDKKNVVKDHIEDIVVDECRKQLTDDNISLIAKEVARLCAEEINSPLIANLNAERKACETAIENLTIALEKGIEIDTILNHIQQRRNDLDAIDKEIAAEEIGKIHLTEPEIVFFLNELRNGNIDTLKYRQGLINVLVNKIFLYDDKIVLILNCGDRPIEISTDIINKINEAQGSYDEVSGVPYKTL